MIVCVIAALGGMYQWAQPVHAQNGEEGDGEIHTLPVQGNIWMLVGAGGNITASIGVDGILLVDAGNARMSEKVIEALDHLNKLVMATAMPPTPCVGVRCPLGPGSGGYNQWGWASPSRDAVISSLAAPKPIRYIVNTSIGSEYTGGNEAVSSAGETLTGSNVARELGARAAQIWAHDAILGRMQSDPKIPEGAWPTDTYYDRLKYKWSESFNGEGIELHHVPAASTDGDTIVFFRYSDVISAGPIYSTVSYPEISVDKGGSIQGVIDGLNKIIDLSFPLARLQGGTYIIPGHGRLSDEGDVVNYRNMVVKLRDRIQDLAGKGMTLEQVKAAKPTLDYDGQYGSPNAFIEGAYRSLKNASK